MATLNILFSGICCHFHDVVPGVPMRAVLPNATAVRFGMVNLPPDPIQPLFDPWVDYYLMPHVPFVTDGTTTKMLAGRHLQVLNPSLDQGFSWVPGGYPLTRFVNDFAFSEDVVLNGNAACYFDVFYGNASTVGSGVAARSTWVQMETDGPPLLKMTPFPGTPPLGLDETPWPIDGDNLWVSNIDYDGSTEDTPFDFLLNYLVARGGIPKQLDKRTPGLTNPRDTAMKDIGVKLEQLGAFIANGGKLTNEKLKELATRPVPLNESCSDSHYP